MPTCPTCGKELSTEQGMRQHHAKVHDESLPNRVCSDCGTEFYDPKARREYCDSCNPNAGKHNGNWKNATEMAECERCGSEFEYYPSDKEGMFCSECVKNADEFLGTHYADVHDIRPVERQCEYCDDTFSILPCHVRQGGGRFCSHDCLSDWLSDQWGDGTAVYNGRWHSVRQIALERDDHCCQYCGKTRGQIGREPDIHHLTPVREFDDPQDAHTLDNLVSLCPSCHRYAEIGEIPESAIKPDSGTGSDEAIESRNE